MNWDGNKNDSGVEKGITSGCNKVHHSRNKFDVEPNIEFLKLSNSFWKRS